MRIRLKASIRTRLLDEVALRQGMSLPGCHWGFVLPVLDLLRT